MPIIELPKILHPKGNQLSYEFTIVNNDRTAANLTGVTPRLTVVDNENDEVELYAKNGTVTNASGGIVEFEVLTTDLTDEGAFLYAIQLTFSNDDVRTIKWGNFVVY